MIDKEKALRAIEAVNSLTDPGEASLDLKGDGAIYISIWPKDWYYGGKHWTEEQRHADLSILTPLVGKLGKHEVDGNISYAGEGNGFSIKINYAERCKILGYRTVKQTVKKEVEREPEFVEVEEEKRVAITDCDIKTGRFKEEDIEVRV